MSLMPVRLISNTDEIQQDIITIDYRLSSCKDGSKDLQIRILTNTDESKECKEQKKFSTAGPFLFRTCGFLYRIWSLIQYYRWMRSAKFKFVSYLTKTQYRNYLFFSIESLFKQKLEQEKKENIKRMQAEPRRRLEEKIKENMKDIEKRDEENMRHMFLMILLLFLLDNVNENIKFTQKRCRKYPSLNSILYLLWQSGDVEANPGPPANSITYRNWLYDVCSVVRKATVGVSPYCKMKNIWKQQPDNWPLAELYFDPRNSNYNVHNVEAFLQVLLHCCEQTSQLPHDIKSEIDTWKSYKSKNNNQLLNLYTRRVCYRSTAQSVTILQSHMSVDEVWEFKPDTSIVAKLSRKPPTYQNLIAPKLFRADTNRKMASFLCRIFNGKDPEQKCDHIWKKTPVGWPLDCRFYNPYNGGKRCAENEDARLVRELITLCENNSIAIPKPYKDMIKAWLADDHALLSKLITRQTAEIGIKKALRKLHEGGLLRDSQVAKQLKELGLFVQSTTSINMTKSQKRKTANATTTSKVKITRIQYDEDEGLDATLKELLPECSIVELLDKSDSHLLDMISPKLSNGFLDDDTDDIQCQ